MKKSISKHLGGTISVIIAVVAVFALMGFKICCDAKYNELNNYYGELTDQYEDLLNEEKQLNISLSSMADLRNVEDIAVNQLGMSKIEQHQINYISLDSGDRVVMVEDNGDGAFSDLFKNFSVLWEYLR